MMFKNTLPPMHFSFLGLFEQSKHIPLGSIIYFSKVASGLLALFSFAKDTDHSTCLVALLTISA
jgi:hypothetical protein